MMGKSSQTPDDQLELALRLMEDDQAALTEVLRRFGPSIAAAFRGKYEVLNDQDIENVLAIALHRLWDARNRYDDSRASLRTYFFHIADNAACDVFKYGWHKARQLEVDYGEDNDLDAIPCPCGDPAGPQETARNRSPTRAERDLREIIEELPDSHRYIIWSDGCARDDVASSQKLADELGVAVTSVRVYRMRAMETIRRKMRERGHDVP